MRRFVLVLVAVAVIPALAVACGDDDDDEDGGNGEATTVNVTLKEFEVIVDRRSAPAGDVRFVTTNDGPEDEHELVVVATALDPANLPLTDDGHVDEDAVEVIGEIEEFAVDETEEATFELESGPYVLLCAIVEEEDEGESENHYVNGMRTAFTVE